MSFLNAILLGGAAALLAPLWIHLLNRSRFQTVDWGAMHLVEAAIESNSRRVQWQSWLLLLIRCLIPVLLAVTLARPVLTHFKQAGADQGKSLVLLLDNSLSMAATDTNDSLLERGKQELARIAEQSAGAELSLWTTTMPAMDQLAGTTLKLPRLRTALERISPATGTDSAGEAIQVGLRARSRLMQPNQHIILASDFQAAQWRRVGENENQAIRSQLSTGDFPAQLFLLPLRSTRPSENLSIEIADAPQTVRLDQTLQLSARVTNHGDAPISDVRITLQVDGQDLASRNIALAIGASEQVEFGCEFNKLGWHPVSVHVHDLASVHGDDVSYHVVQVTSTSKILIVDDTLAEPALGNVPLENNARNRSFSGTSRFLQLALTPFVDRAQNPVQVERIHSSELQQQTLTSFDAVIVANIKNPTPAMFGILHAFVSTGGGLLVFAHPEMNLAAWKNLAEQTDRLLPMRFDEVRSRSAEHPAKLTIFNNSGTSKIFFNPSDAGFENIEFTHWLALSPITDETSANSLLNFSHGEPWLVEREEGRGVVVQCASSCSDNGSNLPSQPAFVPLMLSLVEQISNHAASSASLRTGQTIALQVVEADDHPSPRPSQENWGADSKLSIVVDRVPIEVAGGPSSMNTALTIKLPLAETRALFTDTRVPGVYSARLNSGHALGLAVEPAFFSVNASREESQLEPLSDNELQALAARMGATLIESAEDYGRAETLHRVGWELWRWVLAVLLGLLFAEQVIGLRGSPLAMRGTA